MGCNYGTSHSRQSNNFRSLNSSINMPYAPDRVNLLSSVGSGMFGSQRMGGQTTQYKLLPTQTGVFRTTDSEWRARRYQLAFMNNNLVQYFNLGDSQEGYCSVEYMLQGHNPNKTYMCSKWDYNGKYCDGQMGMTWLTDPREFSSVANDFVPVTTVDVVSKASTALITLSARVYFCPFSYINSESSSDATIDIQLDFDVAVGGVDDPFPPPQPPLPPCEFEINGPAVLRCGKMASYGPVNPYQTSGASYSYEISDLNWNLIYGKNDSSVSVIAPPYSYIRNHPESTRAFLCITKGAPGCSPTTKCIEITADCIATVGPEVKDWAIARRCIPGIRWCNIDHVFTGPLSTR